MYNHNWRNINTIYIYNKTSIKRNILTIKQRHREVGQAKDLSASLYFSWNLVGLVPNVGTQRYRNFIETILLYLLTVYVMDRPVLFVDSH